MFLEKKYISILKNIFFIVLITIQIIFLMYKLRHNKYVYLIKNIQQNIECQSLKIKNLKEEKRKIECKLSSLEKSTFIYEKNAYNKYQYIRESDIIFRLKT